jgi:hypothetical protein
MVNVRRLIARAQRIHPEYAAGRWKPAGTHVVSRMLHALGCHVSQQPMDPNVGGVAVPGVMGKVLVVLNSHEPAEHSFVLRHEMKHVLAEEVTAEAMYLTGDASEMDWAERTADLFALADLVPGHFIRLARRRARRFAPLLEEVREAVAEYAGGWSEGRLNDRAYLRMRLWLDHGV